MNYFGPRLREMRKRKKWTQQELAGYLGVKKSTIGMWENGNREPDFNTLKKVAELFKIPANFFLGEQPYTLWPRIDADRYGVLRTIGLDRVSGLCPFLWEIEPDNPNTADLEEFIDFIGFIADEITYSDSDGWKVTHRTKDQKQKEAEEVRPNFSDPLTDDLLAEVNRLSPDQKRLLLAQIRLMNEQSAK